MKLKKPLPKWAPLVAVAVGGLLVAAVGWMVIVSPQKHRAADLQKQAAAVQQKIDAQLAAVAAAKSSAAAATPQIKVADVYKLAKAMPSTLDMPDLLIELSQVMQDAGVQVQSLSPSPPSTDATGRTTDEINLNVIGDFYTVSDLLYRLRNLVYVRQGALEANGRLFNIDTVNLTPTGSSRVAATITLHAYVYSPPAVTTTAAAPVPTDTTSTTTPSADGSASASAAGAP